MIFLIRQEGEVHSSQRIIGKGKEFEQALSRKNNPDIWNKNEYVVGNMFSNEKNYHNKLLES